MIDTLGSMQGEFNFAAKGDGSGYTKWPAGRSLAAHELARRINLPLGREVEVWLYGGIRLCGKLRLQEEVLSWRKNMSGICRSG